MVVVAVVVVFIILPSRNDFSRLMLRLNGPMVTFRSSLCNVAICTSCVTCTHQRGSSVHLHKTRRLKYDLLELIIILSGKFDNSIAHFYQQT